jgi:malate dehydrogenase
MVPVPSLCRIEGKPLTEVLSPETIEELVERTRNGGAEIVGLLKTGSAYFAPSAAAACMARAVIEDSGKHIPVSAWMTGEYGIEDVYLGVMAEIGAVGVRRIVEEPITDEERQALVAAADAVRAKVTDLEDLGL